MLKYLKKSDPETVKQVLKEAERGRYKGEDKELLPGDILSEHNAEHAVSFIEKEVERENNLFKFQGHSGGSGPSGSRSGGAGPSGHGNSGRGGRGSSSSSRGSRKGSGSRGGFRSRSRNRWADLEGEELKEALENAGVCFQCGNDHKGEPCKYEDAVCGKCGKTGHISPVCFSVEREYQRSQGNRQGKKRPRHKEGSQQSAPNQPPPTEN